MEDFASERNFLHSYTCLNFSRRYLRFIILLVLTVKEFSVILIRNVLEILRCNSLCLSVPGRGSREVKRMNFTGMAGATALSAIAFGVVFLVLIGLTFVIYAMRIVSKGRQ